MMTDCARGRDSWADASEVSFRKSHVRTKQAKHARFQRRFDAGKISWKGDYIGYLSHTTASVVGSSGNSISAINVDGTANNTSAYVDADATVETTDFTGSLFASSPVETATDDVHTSAIVGGKGEFSLAAQISARLSHEKALLECELEAYKEELQKYKQQLVIAETAIQAWTAHAISLENYCIQQAQFDSANESDDTRGWDEARIKAIERSVSEQAVSLIKSDKIIAELQDQFLNHQSLNVDTIHVQLTEFQNANLLCTKQLVLSLQASVQKQNDSLQAQIDKLCQHPRPEGSWANSPGRIDSDTDREAGCDQVQVTNNVVEARPVQRNFRGGSTDRDAGCDQLQVTNNVDEDRPVQRDLVPSGSKGGNAVCHQLQCDQHLSLEDLPHSASEISLDPRSEGSWTKSPGRGILSFVDPQMTMAEFLHVANYIKATRPHIISCEPVLAICDGNAFISDGIVQLPQLFPQSSKQDRLTAEEREVLQMTDEQFHNKMQADQRMLASLYPSGFFEDGSEDVECCSVVHAPSEELAYGQDDSSACCHGYVHAPSLQEECCYEREVAPHDVSSLAIGTRVVLQNLQTKHLNGLPGIVSSDADANFKYQVQLADGTSRKFKREHLCITSGSQSDSATGSGNAWQMHSQF